MAAPPLTRRQRQILDFLLEYGRANSIAPTLEEIAQHFGVTKITIFGHVRELERKGFIERSSPGVSRGIRVLHAESDPTLHVPAAPQEHAPLYIMGTIAAGMPIQAVEEPEQFELSELLPPGNADVFVLRVQGESMIEDAICNGDLVLVERREQANNGETVVAVLPDGEVTLKRLYKEHSGFRLQPANSSMSPIYTDELQIRGVVVGVIRSFNR